MWVFFKHEISREYGRKFRQLQASLRNEDNSTLRFQLLTGEIEPISMVSLSADDLAPKARKDQIENIKKDHFDQRVKMTEESEGGQGLLVVKTSQGLEYIEVKNRPTTEKQPNPEQS